MPSSGPPAHHDKQVYRRLEYVVVVVAISSSVHAIVMSDRKKASALDRPTTFPKIRSTPQAISSACRLVTPFKSLVHILGFMVSFNMLLSRLNPRY
ncbi:hypothetical protein L210DRAFT_980971 [Boletus edulis BED1]|uniref:Uncharacterized protein n=1 Tax=Boletus edulis BED1 TaxID=1328754 RepID=A0AAD4GI54_BOLED|nr:hypothetical protein L210DRAFT_980971 [Boletus edulis BED1]